MANKVSNPYIELFEQLPIPERLEPQNIAAMLEARAAQKPSVEKTSSKKLKETTVVERNITVTSSKRKTSAAYRSIASIAACAALALGIIGYMNVGNSDIPSVGQPDGGAYATDYDDVHDSFQKYYVDDEGKKTLDSALEEIQKSYNESENANGHTMTVNPNNPDDQPDVTDPLQGPVEPDITEPTDPTVPTQPDNPVETIDDSVPLPKNDAVYNNSDVAFGDGFILIRDNNTIRVITSYNGNIDYTDNIFPTYTEQSAKTLVGFYAAGSRVVAVYTAVTASSASASVNDSQTVVGGILDSLYGHEQSTESHSSVEVCVYDIVNGRASLISTTVHGGSLIDTNFVGGALYLVTAYNDYRTAPIIGVDDLESYVPSYTVNGVKYYVQASDIMIPDYISTTDYTVISGISVNGDVSVKAVLGYEGRVLLRNGAVYLFSYDSSNGSDLTSVRVFSLSGGNVIHSGCININGIALSGSGISEFGNTIAVTTVSKDDSGYETTLGVYDGTMNLISRVFFRGVALTTVRKDGDCLYFSGSKDSYGIDLSNPSDPQEITGTPVKDAAKGLVQFGDGYVTLTRSEDGSLVLAKISKNVNGELRLDYKATVSSEKNVSSKAVDNNGLLFVSGEIVGVPYGFFDGQDYCYRYALYRAAATGFELIGSIENHETDEVFENAKAILKGGVLYIFSEGRVYSAVINDAVSLIDTADIVESSYSGH